MNIAISIKQFVSLDFLFAFKSCLIDFTKEFIFSLFYFFLRRKYEDKREKLENLLFRCAQFIALSSIPVLLGIIHPMTENDDLSTFGIEGSLYSGIFGAVHSASFYFSMSFILLLFYYNRPSLSKGMRCFVLLLLLVDVYSIFKCYVRTGWLMCIVGVLIYLYPKKPDLKSKLNFLFVIILCISSLVVFYNTNEGFKARMTGRNIYRNADPHELDMKGSGRTDYWKNGISLWANGNIIEIFIGHTYEEIYDNNYRLSGLHIFSHNNFVNQLAKNGLIGFGLLLAFFYYLYKEIKRHKDSEYYRLALIFLVMLALYNFFQSSFPFLFAFLFPAILICLEKSNPNNSG